MWTLYDRLISSVGDSDKMIRDFTVGTEWCMVIADDGTAGLAPVHTEQWRRFDFGVDIKLGMPLSEAASAIRSWNPHEAALGLATINAFFNREASLTAEAVVYPGGRRSRGVFTHFCELHTKGRRTVMVEPHYDRDELGNAPGLIDIVRLRMQYRDYRFNALEELIPQADGVVISGEAVEDKLAGIAVRTAAELGRDIFFWGPDIPLAPALASVVRMSGSESAVQVTGFIVEDVEKCFWTVKRAGGRDEVLRTGHFVSEQF